MHGVHVQDHTRPHRSATHPSYLTIMHNPRLLPAALDLRLSFAVTTQQDIGPSGHAAPGHRVCIGLDHLAPVGGGCLVSVTVTSGNIHGPQGIRGTRIKLL